MNPHPTPLLACGGGSKRLIKASIGQSNSFIYLPRNQKMVQPRHKLSRTFSVKSFELNVNPKKSFHTHDLVRSSLIGWFHTIFESEDTQMFYQYKVLFTKCHFDTAITSEDEITSGFGKVCKVSDIKPLKYIQFLLDFLIYA